ncbi:MAG: Lrp/AsnC family leucine-responsive transcriptional regulator [Oceanicoccus sp.]|jgi:Lrp/AsnC family leucine-responsive transcriptional regulator
MELDRIDRHILQLMQRNSRINNLELAEQIGLSPTPCSRRVKRLEDSGIIERHATILNRSMLDLKLTAIVGISMDRHTPERFDNFERKIADFPEVLECNIVTGQASDYLLKVVLPDMEYYEEFLLGRLTRIEGVSGVHSSFVLRRVIDKTELPLNHKYDHKLRDKTL